MEKPNSNHGRLLHLSLLIFLHFLCFSLPSSAVDSRSQVVPIPANSMSPSSAFRTLYRVDMGGDGQEQWQPDQEFYATPNIGSESPDITVGWSSPPDWIQDLAVPQSVLSSCRYETVNSTMKPSNLTWTFQVKMNSKQYLRLYFYNCVDATPEDFHLYINNFSTNISSDSDISHPYYREFAVDTDGSGYMNISISPNIADESGMDNSAYLNALEIMELNTEHKSRNRNIVIGLSVAAGAAVLILALILGVLRRRKKTTMKPSDSVKKSSTATSGKKSHSWMTVKSNIQGSPLPELNLKLKMPFAEILAATDNFNPDRLIGAGGFGKVYEGKLVNGVKVAVKRSESGHGQGLPEFQTEVLVLSKIRHRHLVSLIGYCDDGAEMILVYEFMKNGTLREYLYNWEEHDCNSFSKTAPLLNWKQRLEICIGSAQGLHYLHTGSDGGIIHRDVKSTNILLDENLVAKVADFGLSQSGPPDPDHHSMALKGSFGYLDPEFFRTLQLTDKSDVYAFGVVMLEVLCARPPILNSANAEAINLAEWGLMWQKKGEIEKIVDPLIAGEINPGSLRKFAEVAEKCLSQDGVDRPTMLDVCWDLEYALQLQKTPVNREPYDDSMTDASSNIIRPVVSGMEVDHSFTVHEGEEDFSIGDGFGDSGVMDSATFSQHRIDR
ncbi:Receptor-like protein kinase HERK 1 [Linum perenne]